jgi:RNA polymerase sigma-70 factor (ECF subfamily)
MDTRYATTTAVRPPDPAIGTLQCARGGDLAAFDELVRANESRIFSIALRFTGRHADAEELAQDVFVQLHGALPRITDELHLRRWLLRTVTHRCLNRLRDQRRRPQLVPIDTLPEEAEPSAAEPRQDPIMEARLRRLLLELAPEPRAVMLLRFQEDLDPSDIASVLEMSINTVKSHLRRSLEWLRERCAGDRDGT